MIEEIEIEYKQLLNKEEYQKIEQFFIINNTKLINQENLYFETIDKQTGLNILIYPIRDE